MALSCICLIIVCASFNLLNFSDPSHYGNFYSSLKSSSNSKLYFSINFFYRFSTGFILSVLNYSPHVAVYSLFTAIVFLVYQLSIKPFNIGYHNYQSILCQLVIVIILGIRVFYRSFKHNYSIIKISKILLPSYIEIILILLCVVVTLLILVYEISLKYCKRR